MEGRTPETIPCSSQTDIPPRGLLFPREPWLIEVQQIIREDFGWSHQYDQTSIDALLDFLSQEVVSEWGCEGRDRVLASILDRIQALRGIGVAVVGAAVEPDELLPILNENKHLLFADGSVGVLTELEQSDVLLDSGESAAKVAWERTIAVATDGDGEAIHLHKAAVQHIPLVLHAHGHNLDFLMQLLETWATISPTPKLVMSHQLPWPIGGAINVGGFTDGDRGVCFLLAAGLQPNEISLVGFNENRVGRWSGRTDPVVKMRKLDWMKKILNCALGSE